MRKEYDNYDNLEKRLYHNKHLRKLWNKTWKLDECWRCGKKADLGCEITMFRHCRKCYREYWKKVKRLLLF